MNWLLFFCVVFAPYLQGGSLNRSGVCTSQSQTIFLAAPEDFSAKFEVAGCFFEHNNQVLFLLRNPLKPQGSSWCIPGGKLEKAETPRQALTREVQEEIGLDVSLDALRYQQSVYVRLPTADFILHLFHYRFFQKDRPVLQLSLEEHVDYQWVELEKAFELPLIPGGKECFCLVFQEQLKGLGR